MPFNIISVTLLCASLVATSPVLEQRGTPLSPVMTNNFPDPSIIGIGGGAWLAFATQGGGKKVQVAETKSGLGGPWELLDKDLLPNPGAWSKGSNIWAPDVRRIGDKYVLYYSADAKAGHHCVGSATSSDVLGPYVADDESIACPTEQGGAIDISGFQDEDNKNYVVYKVDGGALGGGGACGNQDGSKGTPIMLQEMDASGTKKVGDAKEILDHGPGDGPLVEAPQIIKVNGIYILFFSSNCYNTPLYDISWAYASSIKGPYTKTADGPLAVTNKPFEITAPGGAQATDDGKHLVFHGDCDKGRCMFVRDITIDGNVVKFA